MHVSPKAELKVHANLATDEVCDMHGSNGGEELCASLGTSFSCRQAPDTKGSSMDRLISLPVDRPGGPIPARLDPGGLEGSRRNAEGEGIETNVDPDDKVRGSRSKKTKGLAMIIDDDEFAFAKLREYARNTRTDNEELCEFVAERMLEPSNEAPRTPKK